MIQPRTPGFLSRLDPATLKELAALLEMNRHPVRVVVDPARAAGELAQILERGSIPTIGWWQRNLAPPAPPESLAP